MKKKWLSEFSNMTYGIYVLTVKCEDIFTGAPILKDCMAWFELQVKERHDPGNHTLFIGEVINSGVNSPGTPLCTLEYDGMYIGKK
ncbi:MAG: flavin reductase family protein [Desulfobacula sp.]|nr:flavin reductase family protein [Desulfobacula sp.]